MSSDQENAGSESGGAVYGHLHVNPASIRPAPPVRDRPAAVLLQWRIVRPFGTGCVLVGCLEGGPAIRITTPIVRTEGRRVWTKSGRRYELQCDPAMDEETLELLGERLAVSGHFAFDDVTEEFLAGTLQSEPR